jgi:hypothetical protein
VNEFKYTDAELASFERKFAEVLEYDDAGHDALCDAVAMGSALLMRAKARLAEVERERDELQCVVAEMERAEYETDDDTSEHDAAIKRNTAEAIAEYLDGQGFGFAGDVIRAKWCKP